MKRTNRLNGYAFFVTEPANYINKKVQRKGLRVHVESSRPARHKKKLASSTLQTSLPSLFLMKQGHRVQTI